MENEAVALKIKGYAGLAGYIVDKKQRVLKSDLVPGILQRSL